MILIKDRHLNSSIAAITQSYWGNMILIKDRHMCNKCIAIIYLGEI